jgi:hypothetical protein
MISKIHPAEHKLFAKRRIVLGLSRLMLAGFATTFALFGCSSGVLSNNHPQPSASGSFATNVRIGYPKGDDWEPFIVADGSGHLYATITHFGGAPKTHPYHIQVQRSDDGGATWSKPVPVDPKAPDLNNKPDHSEYDPWMAVDPSDGRTLLLTYMSNAADKFTPDGIGAPYIEFVRSSDLGRTWSTPVHVSGSLGLTEGLDKDAMAVRGKTIAVCFDDFSQMYAGVSSDGGATWSQHKIGKPFATPPEQLLCSGAAIDSQGRIFFAWDTSRKGKPSTTSDPAAEVWIERSNDEGVKWRKTHVDYGGTGYYCHSCGTSLSGVFYASQISLAIDAAGTVYALWNATPEVADPAYQNGPSPHRIYFAESNDHGATFSPRREVSLAPAGVEHSFPTILTSLIPGDVRIAWEEKPTGTRSWNVYYRSRRDKTSAWSGESVISNAAFHFPYGDYFRMTLDNAGKLHAAWGESRGYTSPGNIWVGNQQ